MTAHVLTLEPVYGQSATYVRPTCSCGWSTGMEALRTAKDARARHKAHHDAETADSGSRDDRSTSLNGRGTSHPQERMEP